VVPLRPSQVKLVDNAVFGYQKKNEASIGLKAKNELCNWLLGHVEPVAYSGAAGGLLAALQAKCGISVSVCIKET
jgi:hypothetical protein